MRVEHDKFWLSRFSLDDFRQENLVGVDHTVDYRCESSLVLCTSHRQNDINSVHKVMPWHVILASESEQFELFRQASLLHLDICVIQAALGLLFGLALAVGLPILLL